MASKQALRLVQIGVGGFGQSHLNMVDPFLKAGEVELIAVVDPTPEKWPDLKADYDRRGILWYTDYRAMLEAVGNRVDIVNIATPIPLHEEMVRAVLTESRAWVYLEKPAVPTLEQLESLIELDKDERVYVGFQWVSNPLVRQMRRWVEAGLFGRVESVMVAASWPRLDPYYERASWAGHMIWNGLIAFDGPATNANSHWVNNIMYVLGKGRDYAIPETVEGEYYRARRIESYDTCSLAGTFPEGTHYTVNFTHAGKERIGNNFYLVGERGWVSMNDSDRSMKNSLGLSIDADLQHLCGSNDPSDRYKPMIERARGRSDRFPCTLKDTRGYVVATLGGLVSSGAIHDIPDAYVSRYLNERGEGGVAIHGVEAIIEKAGNTPTLFSRMASWGVRGRLVRREELSNADLYLPFFHAVA